MADSDIPEAAEATRAAIRLAESGDVEGARSALGGVLFTDPGYEPAWAWLASLVERDGERKFCLEKALGAKADARTRRQLRRLRGVEAVAPHEVEWAMELPRPAEETVSSPASGKRHLRWVAAAVVLAVAAAAAAWGAYQAREPDPVHLAFASGISGGHADAVRGMVDAVRMALEETNRSGGIGGRPVELLVFDDADDPSRARQRAEDVVADGRALAVVGHSLSDTSLAATEVYREARLPAITPSATSDRVTTDNPWYFRTVYGNRTQSEFAAVYLREVLGLSRMSVLSEDTEYGRDIREGIISAFSTHGAVTHDLVVDPAPERVDISLGEAVTALKAEPDLGAVVLALGSEHGARVVADLRAAGITAPLLAGDALAGDSFHQALRSELDRREPRPSPGELYAISPMARDALTGSALQWSTAFQAAHGYAPAWQAATAYESAVAALHALRSPGLEFTSDSRDADRRRVRDALAAMNSPETAPDGVLGPIRFDQAGSAQREVSVVRSDGTRFVSAPVQLAPHSPEPSAAADEEAAAGRAVAFSGQLLAERRIVTAGVNVNEIGELDTEEGTFFADFFLWLRYTGDDSAADVTFANAADPDLTLGEPIRTSTADGQTYRLHRVAEQFKADFDFRSFPFDRQNVTLVLQNRRLPESQLVYVTDPVLLDQPQQERLRGGHDVAAGIDHIPNWTAGEVRFYRETVGSNAELGNPSHDIGTHYSQYVTDVRIHRDLGGFLVKNLLPLALLVALTYLSLYFPPGAGAGYSINITAVLTGAVLLTTVTSPLPEVSYTVAIEWAYYAFILLAISCLLTNLLRQQLTGTTHGALATRLSLGARIAHPLVVAAIVLAYAAIFG